MIRRSSFPPFAMLRAFEAFGRLGVVRKAALELDVDHAVVSRHLRSLEAFVGTSLIERSPSSDTWLTEQGQLYHARISSGFREICEATDVLRRQNDSRLLVCCSPGLAYYWLMPRLPGFGSRHPQFELSLRPSDLAADFQSNSIDGDLRYVRSWENPVTRPGLRAIDLASPGIVPVASPSYLAHAKPIRKISDLLTHRLLHEDSDDEWRRWLEEQGVAFDGELPGARLWHAHLSLDAALKGHGVALANQFLLGDALARGDLVIATPSDEVYKRVELGTYSFIAREDRWRSLPVLRFREWLVSEFEARALIPA